MISDTEKQLQLRQILGCHNFARLEIFKNSPADWNYGGEKQLNIDSLKLFETFLLSGVKLIADNIAIFLTSSGDIEFDYTFYSGDSMHADFRPHIIEFYDTRKDSTTTIADYDLSKFLTFFK